MSTEATKKLSAFDRFLNGLEKAANLLPSPFTLFTAFFVITAVVSLICDVSGAVLLNPAGEEVRANNFFTQEGLHWLLGNFVKNFTGYAPLGLVLVMTFGIGMCEQTGLVTVLIRKAMANVPAKLVPFVLAFVGINGNIASDSAAVILPPIGAMVFLGVGLHPIAGMLCTYAGTNAGFSANLAIAGTDALSVGLTNGALEGFLPGSGFQLDVACNWYFFATSCIYLTFVIGFVDILVIEPRLGKYTGGAVASDAPITDIENKGLRNAGLTLLAYLIVLGIGMFAKPGLLLTEDMKIVGSPFLANLIPILFFMFLICGIAYGITLGHIKTERDISRLLTKAIGTMSSYITFILIAAQFNYLFAWTKLGSMLAILGSNFLNAIGFTGIPMMVVFIAIVACINLLVGSNSAKWALLAPIFIPMFMMLGYHPAYIQMMYRVGDSATNILSPTSAYLFMMLALAQEKYDPDVKVGTLLSNLFPHSMIVLVMWTILGVAWTLVGLPCGPGEAYTYISESAVLAPIMESTYGLVF